MAHTLTERVSRGGQDRAIIQSPEQGTMSISQYRAAAQKRRLVPQADRVLSVKDVALLLGYDYKYTLSLFSKGVIPGRQRAKGCKITVRRSTIDRLFPEQARQRHD